MSSPYQYNLPETAICPGCDTMVVLPVMVSEDGSLPICGTCGSEVPDPRIAVAAAEAAGFHGFCPDACLINSYRPGARLSLHQDKNERDFANPIVSVSLGLPATFQFGGLKRNDPIRKFALRHGDVAVWGGPSRLCYHGVPDLKDGRHESVGRVRINLTFRGAL